MNNSGRKRVRRKLSEAQNHRCCYCSVTVWLDCDDGPLATQATIEHIVTRANGGGNTQDNLVVSCAACNVERDQMDAFEYYEMHQNPQQLNMWRDARKQRRKQVKKRSKDRKKLRQKICSTPPSAIRYGYGHKWGLTYFLAHKNIVSRPVITFSLLIKLLKWA